MNVEPILKLLAALLVFFTLAMFACKHWFPADTTLFTVVSTWVGSIGGAFLMRVKQGTDVQPPTK